MATATRQTATIDGLTDRQVAQLIVKVARTPQHGGGINAAAVDRKGTLWIASRSQERRVMKPTFLGEDRWCIPGTVVCAGRGDALVLDTDLLMWASYVGWSGPSAGEPEKALAARGAVDVLVERAGDARAWARTGWTSSYALWMASNLVANCAHGELCGRSQHGSRMPE
ncbi:hypothetical protein [Luteipulveratus halotolerans]|uniref:Uncharacterized protein n=1 Tax=Luteipulveratus halotolerans TaxID=1631356 RepID=A0A0L6CF10_9MICO|nr:hypothetical protein [Luteipulveratus halotolerans]KNX36093.1 hypothetical protein VV01_01295 [Luteipulveratus halotolerans]